MQSHVTDTQKKLGELAVMARQTADAEQKILDAAMKRLEDVQGKLPAARAAALAGGDAEKAAYNTLIAERGQLNQVIAQSRVHLDS